MIATMHRVAGGVSRHGVALFEDHPVSDDLVRYAASDRELPTADLARIRDHVEACSTCREDLALARRAGVDRPEPASWWSRLVGGDSRPTSAWARFAPVAAALLVVAMAFPAYLGLVELPKLERSSVVAWQRVFKLEQERRALKPERQPGGAVRLLYLTASTRTASAPPVIALKPGQPFQPLVLEIEPDRSRLGDEALVLLRRLPGGDPAWSVRAPLADLWDPANRVVSLLVPATALPPGSYEIELRIGNRAPERAPDFVARFTVTAAR